jgi:hypothetical protein
VGRARFSLQRGKPISNPGVSAEILQQTIDAAAEHGSIAAAARALDIPESTFRNRFLSAQKAGFLPTLIDPVILPAELGPVEELIDRRKEQFNRKTRAVAARRLIPVRVRLDGPIGVVHFGDPHIDDDGTDIQKLQTHVGVVNKTEGMFGANVGDLQNAWIGRLAHLFGEQSTSRAEAWQLTEWLVTSVNWLYLVGGNHDIWAGAGQGAGDPVEWMTKKQTGVYEAHGARLSLKFPNSKAVRINCRHDFSGHSMWNTAHGPAKAIQMGWRDHILTCGHKHTSGYQVLKDPASGLISHAIRVAGYKIHDRYADEKGLPDQNIAPAFVTIINPIFDDNDPRLVTTIFDVEEGADYLTYLRAKYA